MNELNNRKKLLNELPSLPLTDSMHELLGTFIELLNQSRAITVEMVKETQHFYEYEMGNEDEAETAPELFTLLKMQSALAAEREIAVEWHTRFVQAEKEIEMMNYTY